MKQSQREVVAILVPPLSNSLPQWGESTEFSSPLGEEGRVRKVRERKTSPSPLGGEGVQNFPLHLMERVRVRKGRG